MTTGVHGILVPVSRLDRWLQAVLAALVVACAIRYVDRHGLGDAGVLVLAGGAGLATAYATRPLLSARTWWPTVWVVAMVVLWMVLTLVAPSFAWCAVPIAFAVLQVLPFGWAVGTVAVMTAVVGVAWSRIIDFLDPTVIVGPIGIALVTVLVYRNLERESVARQTLLDELTEAQDELAGEQHRSGALAERTRLSREIHDSVGQGLSSINLLLQAAEQSWDRDPVAARRHIGTAATTARDGLEEVRRVVRDLAPSELAEDGSGTALPDALRRLLASVPPGLEAEVRVHGTPLPVAAEVSGAIVRTARGALANVLEHAAASRVVLSLTYQADEVLLDVRDDGRGFLGSQTRPSGMRGRGLSGIRERAASLGGRADVESSPGEGTTVSVAFGLERSP